MWVASPRICFARTWSFGTGPESDRELEAAERTTPNAIAAAFAKALGKPVRAQIAPRAEWEQAFRAQGMKNPTPRMQMIDGFNEGWIDFKTQGANGRKGRVTIDEAIAALVAIEEKRQV